MSRKALPTKRAKHVRRAWAVKLANGLLHFVVNIDGSVVPGVYPTRRIARGRTPLGLGARVVRVTVTVEEVS